MDQVSFITSFVTNIVSAVQNGFQMAANNKEINSNITALNDRYKVDASLLKLQASQIDSQAALEIEQREKQATRERARMLVAMGDAGVAGNSMLRELASSYVDQSVDVGVINTNKNNNLAQNLAAQKSARMGLDSQVAKLESQKTSFLEGFLQTSNTLSGGMNIMAPVFGSILKDRLK